MEHNNILRDYTFLTKIDIALNKLDTQYPFKISDNIKYTQHNVKLYKANFCFNDKKNPPAKTGGLDPSIFILAYDD